MSAAQHSGSGSKGSHGGHGSHASHGSRGSHGSHAGSGSDLESRILSHMKSPRYRAQKPRSLARELNVHHEESYNEFKEVLRALIKGGRVVIAAKQTVALAPPVEPKTHVLKAGAPKAHAPKADAAKAHAPKGKGKGAHEETAAAADADAGVEVVEGEIDNEEGDSGEVAAPAHRRPAKLHQQPKTAAAERGVVVGPYRHNRRGFGFVDPTEPVGHESLFIPPGHNAGAISGDIVSAKITGSDRTEGKKRYEGRVIGIVERSTTKFVGTLVKQGTQWIVLPDGNDFIDPIEAPDAGSRHIKPGTKVAVELTRYPEGDVRAQGVIVEVLGKAGEKDVDLRSVIIQYNLPGEFPEEVVEEARQSLHRFNTTLEAERESRLDMSDAVICTIDPDDAKDYDDAISLRKLENGNWQLGVHIADVSFFVPPGSALDVEAAERGNSAYFPGHVIPMLPEVLSNGVCSLQEGVPRLCKSAFIELDENARPVGTKFANTIIKSRKRLRYREAQAILDNQEMIPHPDGDRSVNDYPAEVVALLHDMDRLAKRIQKRRHDAGQLVLQLPEIDLVLDEEGKVIGAVPEDESYTHTLIEMFMVEANEAVARLLDSLDVPFLRRAHADPDPEAGERLRNFALVAGYKLPKTLDRKALQTLLETVKDRPEAFAINMAVLRSLSRAEYSPLPIGHYALASTHYAHFTSPIRRYADLTVHRLLDAYFEARERSGSMPSPHVRGGKRTRALKLEDVIPHDELVTLGKHISHTERRAEDAENELRKVKVLELLKGRIGDEFHGVVTSVTKFGVFVQLREYLIDGLIRYEDLMDDYWDVDERTGVVKGRNTGIRITVGDLCTLVVVNVDVPRRELDVAIVNLHGKAHKAPQREAGHPKGRTKKAKEREAHAKTPQQRQKQVDRRTSRMSSGGGKPRRGGGGGGGSGGGGGGGRRRRR